MPAARHFSRSPGLALVGGHGLPAVFGDRDLVTHPFQEAHREAPIHLSSWFWTFVAEFLLSAEQDGGHLRPSLGIPIKAATRATQAPAHSGRRTHMCAGARLGPCRSTPWPRVPRSRGGRVIAQRAPMIHRIEWEAAAPAVDSGLLARVGEDRELLAEVIALFLEDAPALIAAMRQALAAGDCAAERMAAHSLAGSAANFDATEVTALARRLEAHALAGNVPASREAFSQLDSETTLLLARLSTTLASLRCAS